jgi:hypothetical protein
MARGDTSSRRSAGRVARPAPPQHQNPLRVALAVTRVLVSVELPLRFPKGAR